MGAAGLVNIRRRIKSVKSTKKITNAMGLVATSKVKRVKAKLYSNDNYINAYKEIISEVLPSIPEDNIYLIGNKSDKKLIIVLTSDMGLCGAFNNNIISYMNEFIGEKRDIFKVLMVGQKGKNIIKKFRYDTIAEYVDIPDVPTIKEGSVIFRKALEAFLRGDVGEVYVVYTKFINQLRKETSSFKILPLEKDSFKDLKGNLEEVKRDFELEGNREELISGLLSPYFNSIILNAMIHSKVSEQSFRMEAMEGATKNADELIDKLTLKYNRIRQSAITQEISEIVGGAQAQN